MARAIGERLWCRTCNARPAGYGHGGRCHECAQGRTCMVDGCENRAALRQAVCAAHVDARTSGI